MVPSSRRSYVASRAWRLLGDAAPADGSGAHRGAAAAAQRFSDGSDAAAHDSGRMMRTMDPFSTWSAAVRLETDAAPRAGGATSALALAASAVKQATLNILRPSGSVWPSQAVQSAYIDLIELLHARYLTNFS